MEANRVVLKSTKSRSAGKQDEDKVAKFESYFDSSFGITTVKPHVVSSHK